MSPPANDPQEAMAYAAAGLLSPSFARALARNRPRFSSCQYHGEVVLVDKDYQPTDGPDGTCPHCRRERDAGIRIGCAEHGLQPTDAKTGLCLVCVTLGVPADVAAGSRHHVGVETLTEHDIHPPEIFAKPGERQGGDAEPRVVERPDVLAAEGADAAGGGSHRDRPGGEAVAAVVREPGDEGDPRGAEQPDVIVQAALLERIGRLKALVRDGRPEAEDFVALGTLMREARAMGLM